MAQDRRDDLPPAEEVAAEERIVDVEPPVLQGEDDVPRQPAPPLDPCTPAPGPGPGEERAFRVLRWAWVPILVVIAIILFAFTR